MRILSFRKLVTSTLTGLLVAAGLTFTATPSQAAFLGDISGTNSSQANLVVTSTGTFVAAWITFDGGSVVKTRTSTDGENWSATVNMFTPLSGGTDSVDGLHLTVTTNDKVVAIWNQRQDTTLERPSNGSIYSATFAAGAWSTPVLVFQGNASSGSGQQMIASHAAYSPNIVASSTTPNKLMAVWAERQSTWGATYHYIKSAVSTDAGASWTQITNVNEPSTSTTASNGHPLLDTQVIHVCDATPTCKYVVAWREATVGLQSESNTDPSYVWTAMISDSVSGINSPDWFRQDHELSQNSLGNKRATLPRLSSPMPGYVLLSWGLTETDTGRTSIYSRASSDFGATWGSVTNAIENSAAAGADAGALESSVITLNRSTGKSVALWNFNTNHMNSSMTTYISVGETTGTGTSAATAWGTRVSISSSANLILGRTPFLAMAGTKVVALWSDSDSRTGIAKIYKSVSSDDGATWNTPSVVSDPSPGRGEDSMSPVGVVGPGSDPTIFTAWTKQSTFVGASGTATTLGTGVRAAAAPGTPGTPTAVAGNGSVTVTVVAPSSGGTPTSYTVTSSPGGLTCTVTPPATSCEVTGLTNGTSYTFVTTATNSGGTSSSSGPSASVTPVAPVSAPGTPGTPTAVAGNGSVTVTVVAPTSGGTPTSYTVTSSPGSLTCTVTPPATSCEVTGLTNGTSYTFVTTATNSGGTSSSSASSSSVTPTASSSSGSSSGGSGATGGSAPATSTPSNASGGASSALGATLPTTTPAQGSSNTTVNGAAVPTTTSANLASRSVTSTSKGASGGSVTFSSIKNGVTQPLTGNNTLGVGLGSWINVSGKTYKANSSVQVYLISSTGTATYIGSLTANAKGVVKGKLQVPSSMAIGKYTLQLNGYTKTKSKVRRSNLGMEIAGDELGSLFFDADTAEATEATKAAVRDIASKLASGDKVVLFGFTAGSTASKYRKANLALAKNRAATVKALFEAAGHSASIVIVPTGAEKGGHNKPNSRRVDVRKVN